MFGETFNSADGEIKVSFDYQCNSRRGSFEDSGGCEDFPRDRLKRASRSFSCLSAAALSANPTLANTNICNGIISSEILPNLDSPNSFRRIPSSPSLYSKFDLLSSSLLSTLSSLSNSPSTSGEYLEGDSYLKCENCPNEGFLNALEVQVAGGAAGEDRVQAVCSEEDGWLFSAIYDGFNGRDAADFLAGTYYDTFLMNFNLLNWDVKEDVAGLSTGLGKCYLRAGDKKDSDLSIFSYKNDVDMSLDSFKQGVLECLRQALSQVESDYLGMVEREMKDRPDLVSVGSCVLVALLVGKYLYTLSLGDSRAVLATLSGDSSAGDTKRLKALQLTDIHTVENDVERSTLLSNHLDDAATIDHGKVKGKLKVTRAFGVGYLKKKELNDALMGILRVHNLISPPYISTSPCVNVHRISKSDCFVILGSDGLFDFFTNEEAVKLVHSYILRNPSGNPAKFLLDQLVVKAADCAGINMDKLMSIPPGRRRKYHDDVTVIVIILGLNQRTSKASMCL